MKVELSDRMIAQETGQVAMTIGRYRKTLEDLGEVEPQETRLGKDGVTQNIGVTNVTPEEPKVDPFNEWFYDRA